MGVTMVMIVMPMIVVMMIVVTLMVVLAQFGGVLVIAMMFMIQSMHVAFAVLMMLMFVMVMLVMTVLVMLMRLLGVCRIGVRTLDHGALHAIAMAAAARIAVARTAAVGAVFAFFLGLAMGALIGFDQRLPVGDRDLVVVRVDFGEGEEAVAVPAVIDERRLQRRFDACDLG